MGFILLVSKKMNLKKTGEKNSLVTGGTLSQNADRALRVRFKAPVPIPAIRAE